MKVYLKNAECYEKKIRSAGRVTEKDVKAMMREVRMALLEADI